MIWFMTILDDDISMTLLAFFDWLALDIFILDIATRLTDWPNMMILFLLPHDDWRAPMGYYIGKW